MQSYSGSSLAERIEERSRPTEAVWRAENEPSLDVWDPPKPFRRLRMAEHCTPDIELGPVHSSIGSKIGYRHHQPCRPAFIPDAIGRSPSSARGVREKVGTKVAYRKIVHHGDTETQRKQGNF